MALQNLFASKPVLTHAEVTACLNQEYSRHGRSQESLLSYHLRKGHLLRVRRGLYAVVPPGSDPETYPVNPYLLAAKLADDAVLAYHTALAFHGKAHSVSEWYYFKSKRSVRPMTFRTYRFESVLFPKTLRNKGREFFAVKTMERSGLDIRVTSLERTLVDVLDRPKLAGGWEEIWRSLESIEYFKLDLVIEYALLLGNATTTSKVGYYLDQHRESLMVEDHHLRSLRKQRPKRPHYLERGRSGKLVSYWNLVLPTMLVERTWEEIT